jgi:uncharacterized protein (DUF2235 family)
MPASRAPRTLVHIVDGTLSSLEPGRETHAGRLRNLLAELGPRADLAVGYHPGVQGQGLDRWLRAATGRGVNDAIRHAYAHLASRYRPGDRIFLFGYSRGAYAVRSLAGLIDRIGLLRPEAALERRVHRAFRLYAHGSARARAAFAARHCWPQATIEMIGVWDTVKALGLPYPVLSRIHPAATEFHDHDLGPHIRNGFQALALDEDRTAFRPVLWDRKEGFNGRLEQLWFPGAHGDVGGMLDGFEAARPLADIPLVWMLEQAEPLGLPLPEGWRARFETDAAAPMLGARRGIARLFLSRAPRRVALHQGEDLHPSVAARMQALNYRPRARGLARDD